MLLYERDTELRGRRKERNSGKAISCTTKLSVLVTQVRRGIRSHALGFSVVPSSTKDGTLSVT